TSWPGLFLLLTGGGGKKSGILFFPPGEGEVPEERPENSALNTTDPSQTSNKSPGIQFTTTSSNYLESDGEINIPVNLSGDISADVNVSYTITGGTASGAGVDYTLDNGIITFTPGTSTQNIKINLIDDLIVEQNETIILTLSIPDASFPLGNNVVHTVTIVDNDSANVSFENISSNDSESVNSVSIPVKISMESSEIITVDYSVIGGSATEGIDYNFSSGTLNFPANSTDPQYINFSIIDDSIYEGNETIIISLSNPTNSNLGVNNTHTYTINENDSSPTVEFNTISSNGSESVTNVSIPVSLNASSGLTSSVNYSVTGGSAVNGVDYSLSSGTLTFTAGETTQNINFTVTNDTVDEPAETIVITLSSPTGSNLGSNITHTYTINDDDLAPNISFDNVNSSGQENISDVTIPVSLSNLSEQVVTVDYSVSGGTASFGSDYNLSSGTLTFNPGTATQYINLSIVDDSIFEDNETIEILLSNGGNATVAGNVIHTYTIINDDNPPSVEFNTISSSGLESITSVNIPVSLSAVAGKSLSIDYAVTGGTATGGGNDYTLASGTLVFNEGVTSLNIPMVIKDDSITEENETIIISLANPTGGVVSGSNTTFTYTIIDNDPPSIEFTNSNSNGSENISSVNIPVNINSSYGTEVKVDYSVTGGSATAGTDFTLSSGTLTFSPGTTTQNINLSVTDDSLDEPDETVIITLTNPSNGTIGTNSTFTYTILDNDNGPTVSFDNSISNASENSGTVNIPVSLSGISGQIVKINYSISGGSATGGGQDYTLVDGIIEFNPGETTKNIPIEIINDNKDEEDETVIITLSNPINSSLGTNANHTFTITDDDPSPTISFDSSFSNGSENIPSVNIPVSLSNPSDRPISIDYSVSGGSAVSGIDYTLTAGTLNFPAGTTTQNIGISIIDNQTTNINKTIEISISNPINSSLGTNTNHVFTINDNDIPGVTVSKSTLSISEAGINDTYTLLLTSKPTSNVTISFGVDSQLNSITDIVFTPSDYNSPKTITVSAVNDDTAEGNHTGNINHSVTSLDSNYNGISISGVIANITDNDNAGINLSKSNVSVEEGGVTDSYTILLTSKPTSDVTVSFSTGTQINAISSIVLNSTNWNSPQTITVRAKDDYIVEGNHIGSITHSVVSSDALYNGFSVSDITAAITDNDTANLTITESGGSTNVTEGGATDSYTIVLTSQPSSDVIVSFNTGTQVTSILPVTFTSSDWNTPKTITVSAIDDTIYESNHTQSITHNTSSSDSNYNSLPVSSVLVNITDNDSIPNVSFALANSDSVDESSGNRTITISLSAPSSISGSVQVMDTGGTATEGVDYNSIGSPLTVNFPAGTTSQTIEIPVIQDLEFEGNETVVLSLSSPSNLTLGTITTHTFIIIDDEIGILSAETMDIDGNGQIDHYKVTFSSPVQDSSFPGYSANSIGLAQTDWLVGGTSSGVYLSHGNAEPLLGDIPNDNVLYLKFDESGVFDTDSKPELTTSSDPGLITTDSKTVAVAYVASVTELDRAKPVIVSNTGTTGSTDLYVTYSEPVWGAPDMPACGAGGELTYLSLSYMDSSSNGVSSVVGMGADSCGSDSTVIYSANSTFLSSDNGIDSIAGNNFVFDAANNTGNPIPIKIAITDPIITNIQQFDTNNNGKIDQVRVTFSINMNDSSISDGDAVQFLLNGIPFTLVDSMSGGTGIISFPNSDPGMANDNVITLFTDDSSVIGTELKSMNFTYNAGRWLGSNGVSLQSIPSLNTVIEDKAPPVILTAVASDGSVLAAGVDSDDTLVITFSESTNKPDINNGNISSILGLNNGHSWGSIDSAVWNSTGDKLTITFSGSGSSVAVGDSITILGTISDTAPSPNIANNLIAVNPISGTFFMVDTSTPTVSSATSIDATTVRVTYSKEMNSSDAGNLGNYLIVSADSGTCSDNSNFTTGSGALAISNITQVDTKTYDLTTSPQSAITYTLIVNKSGVHDLQPITLSCPNNADFTGNENIKASSAVCVNTTEVIFTFSKPVKTGMNVAGSGECNSTIECGNRYYITPNTLGSISSVKVLDGVNCGGAPANSSKVCITHSLPQGGGNYTVIAANGEDGDGFNNSTWGGIQNVNSPIGNLQSSPKDRVSFTGCGTTINNFADGPISTDPFGDNAYFGYVMSYFNKIYAGPNTNGNAASRFNPDGSNPETLSFEFVKDVSTTNGSGVSSNSASSRDGGIAVPPYVTIGHTGCSKSVADSANIATGCGPNLEDGRGLFASGVVNGTEYLFITGARSNGNDDYLYYTTDTDTLLNFKYLDASATFNGAGIGGNSGTESIIVLNNRVYWMLPGNRGYRPYFVKINTLTQDQRAGVDSEFMSMRFMTGFGG
ncbi:MAG: hypothetical protein KDK36_04570, partial [Leptospiraceae bacterium]|nr:hypothetical protein [Leptospiraceae bacterium]